MRDRAIAWTVATLVLLCGCASPTAPAGPAAPPPPTEAAAPAILPRPFTAEQIREEWIPGLTLTLRRVGPAGAVLERWRVVAADEAGAEIEFAALDQAGAVTGLPKTKRSTWVELRDHATFDADRSSRTAATRDTPLGRLDGWLYRSTDEVEGTRSEVFFAHALPGAPIEMRVTRGDELLLELTQVARERPEAGPRP
jgi:hypothetical protein